MHRPAYGALSVTALNDGACYQLPWPAIKAYKVGLLHADGAYRVGRTRRPHNLYATEALGLN